MRWGTTWSRRRTPLNTNESSNDGAPASGGPSRTERLRQRNLFEELLRIRDAQREQKRKAIWLIKGKELPWEINRHGKMRWYMHPALEDVALRTLLLYMQEIPPGSRSGRQKCQGSIVLYVLEGRGYTILNSTRYPWKAGDLINLPIRLEGITYQHFNADPEHRALLVAVEPNLVDVLGVDKGAGFDELEPAPEYVEQREQGNQPAHP